MSLIQIEYRVTIRRHVPEGLQRHSPQWRLFLEDAIKERIRDHGLVNWSANYRNDAYLEEGYASCGCRTIQEELEEH